MIPGFDMWDLAFFFLFIVLIILVCLIYFEFWNIELHFCEAVTYHRPIKDQLTIDLENNQQMNPLWK